MIEDDDGETEARTLHRMIAYLRREALRLRIMDVAQLLEHAEDAVVCFSLASLQERSRRPCDRRGSGGDH